MERFGTIVRKLREERGWTQEYVARRVGTHKGYVSGIEKGRVNPPVARMIVRFAALFKADAKDLVLRAVVEKAPKLVREELEKRVFGE